MTLVNATGAAWGVANDETSVNIEEFKVSVKPEFIEPLMNKDNTRRGAAVAPQMVTVDMSGETLGSTGALAAGLTTTAFTPVNSYAFFGSNSPDLLQTQGDVTANRSAWQKFSTTFEGYQGQNV